jgi:tetratricopeptide (TPR) repeat protein
LKCLQKEPSCRYQTAAELKDALSTVSTSSKKSTIKTCITGAAVLSVLLLAGSVALLLARRPLPAAQPPTQSLPARAELTRLSDFHGSPEELIHTADTYRSGEAGFPEDHGKARKFYDLARKAAQKDNEPALAARVLLKLGKMYEAEGKRDEALRVYQQAIKELTAFLQAAPHGKEGFDDTDYKLEIVETYRRLAGLQQGRDSRAAIAFLLEALKICPAHKSEKYLLKRDIYNSLSSMGRNDEAEKLLLKSLAELEHEDKSDIDMLVETGWYDATLARIDLSRCEYGKLNSRVDAIVAISSKIDGAQFIEVKGPLGHGSLVGAVPRMNGGQYARLCNDLSRHLFSHQQYQNSLKLARCVLSLTNSDIKAREKKEAQELFERSRAAMENNGSPLPRQ